jgi:hypothetical protein
MTRPNIPMNIALEHMIIKVAVELSIRVLIVRIGGLELFESVSVHESFADSCYLIIRQCYGVLIGRVWRRLEAMLSIVSSLE